MGTKESIQLWRARICQRNKSNDFHMAFAETRTPYIHIADDVTKNKSNTYIT